MISKLHDNDQKVTIPGFYDKVVEISDEEKKEISKVPFDIIDFNKSIGIKGIIGESGYSTQERKSTRPCLDVNGIWGGYIDEGSKTVIPSKASAKLSMRLVPFQDWKEIGSSLKSYLRITCTKLRKTRHKGISRWKSLCRFKREHRLQSCLSSIQGCVWCQPLSRSEVVVAFLSFQILKLF